MRYFLILACFAVSALGGNFKDHIHFIVYQNNIPVNTSELDTRNPVEEGLCVAGKQLAVITHGWEFSCSQDWVIDLVAKLTIHRGDCIICMDYSYYSTNPYLILLAQFNHIKQVLYDQMVEYGAAGLLPSDTYMFGFSLGAHLILQAAARLGYQIIKQIDVCDPAGPGFTLMPDAKLSAKNVQCIHTSIDNGTPYRNCNQDWLMGNCGISQPGASDPPMGNHGLCPYFYNSAFDYDFPAIPRPLQCLPTLTDANCPKNYTMGYLQKDKEQVQGILYARTTEEYPWT